MQGGRQKPHCTGASVLRKVLLQIAVGSVGYGKARRFSPRETLRPKVNFPGWPCYNSR